MKSVYCKNYQLVSGRKLALIWIALILSAAVLAAVIVPVLHDCYDRKHNPVYGTVTAKGIDHGEGGIVDAVMRTGRFCDGQTHWLLEVTNGDTVRWWEVTEQTYWTARIGDTVCRMNVE